MVRLVSSGHHPDSYPCSKPLAGFRPSSGLWAHEATLVLLSPAWGWQCHLLARADSLGAVGVPEAQRHFLVDSRVDSGVEAQLMCSKAMVGAVYRGRTGMQEPSGDCSHPAAGACSDPGGRTPGASHCLDAQTPGMTMVNAERVWEGINPQEWGFQPITLGVGMRHRRGQLILQLPTVRFSHFPHCGFWPVGERDMASEGSGIPSSLETSPFLQLGITGELHPAGYSRTGLGSPS